MKGREIKISSKANEVQFDEFGTIADYVFVVSSESDSPKEDLS